jgi:tetratricopeptide (TPR) repeat protein
MLSLGPGRLRLESVAMNPTAAELCAAGYDAVFEAGFRSGDFAEARNLLDSAMTRAATEGDSAVEASVMDGLGLLAHFRHIAALMNGDPVADADVLAEESLFRRALTLHRQVDGTAGSALSLFGIGLVFQVLRRDWTSAMPYFQEALEIVEREPMVDLYTRSEVHRHIGFYYLVEAVDPAAAVRHLQISLDLRDELGDPRRIPSGLLALGQAELAAGNRERALQLLEHAVTRARSAGLTRERIIDMERTLQAAQSDLG